MPIDVRCECGKEYQVDESRVGKRGRCRCGRAVLIEPEPEPPPIRLGVDRLVPIKTTHIDTMDGKPTRSPKVNGYYWHFREVRDNRPEDMPDGQSSRDLVARTKAARAARLAAGTLDPPITRETPYGDVQFAMKRKRLAELNAECDRLNAENTVPGRIYRVLENAVSLNRPESDDVPKIGYQDVGPRPTEARIPGTYSKPKSSQDGDV